MLDSSLLICEDLPPEEHVSIDVVIKQSTQQNCVICLEHFDLTDVVSVCPVVTHTFCVHCLSAYLRLQIREANVNVKCPGGPTSTHRSCPATLSEAHIKLYCPEDLARYERFKVLKVQTQITLTTLVIFTTLTQGDLSLRECPYCGLLVSTNNPNSPSTNELEDPNSVVCGKNHLKMCVCGMDNSHTSHNNHKNPYRQRSCVLSPPQQRSS